MTLKLVTGSGDKKQESIPEIFKDANLAIHKNTSPDSIEDAIGAYRTFEEKNIPIVMRTSQLIGDELYKSFVKNVSEHNNLKGFGAAHGEQLVKDHEDVLIKNLATYALEKIKKHGHSKFEELVNKLYKDEEKRHEAILSHYDAITNVNPEKGEGLLRIKNSIKEQKGLKIDELYQLVRGEATQKAPERIAQKLMGSATNALLGNFENHEIQHYVLNEFEKRKHEIEDPVQFSQFNKNMYIRLLKDAEKGESSLEGGWKQAGIKFNDPAKLYKDKAA
ncbi:MAG: hypothetical protein ACMXYD_02775 [Candidatus Woesearchaeota archaeon]